MTTEEFFEQLDERISRYDLLCHPFYQAWAAGELSREDLREYAVAYYPHVQAFPGYLAILSLRLEESELRRAVLANMTDEKGSEDASNQSGRAHAELWLDFAEGMGASRAMIKCKAVPAVKQLTAFFTRIACDGAPEEALAAFYAYESQVPRVAREKTRGLREMYGADERTCAYFTLHTTADVLHSRVWRQQLAKALRADPLSAGKTLAAAEAAARALWQALDGIEEWRRARTAAA
jgi:pyrroloquinoline-quinone synthase